MSIKKKTTGTLAKWFFGNFIRVKPFNDSCLVSSVNWIKKCYMNFRFQSQRKIQCHKHENGEHRVTLYFHVSFTQYWVQGRSRLLRLLRWVFQWDSVSIDKSIACYQKLRRWFIEVCEPQPIESQLFSHSNRFYVSKLFPKNFFAFVSKFVYF